MTLSCLLCGISLFASVQATTIPSDEIWPIRSIDTMKMSRDQARAKLNDPTFDLVIEREVIAIKDLGANYVAIGTPYDEEFKPFLERWVSAARRHNLNVWFRGTFSAYEGWFEYPKSLSPAELLEKSQFFIENNAELFQDGDIFDACPECENAGHWPQPQSDAEYNRFIQEKQRVLSSSFSKIDKQVYTNYPSIIGGRAKEVLDQPTLNALGNVVTINHYHPDPTNYREYISYFADQHQTKVLFGEVGAPIPDMHGSLSEVEQAAFMRAVFAELYQQRDQVIGINYWVYSNGTTALVNPDYQPRAVAAVVQDFFQPAYLTGRVTNPLGDPISEVEIQIDSVTFIYSNPDGTYAIPLPPGRYDLEFAHTEFNATSTEIQAQRSTPLQVDTILEPKTKNWIYRLREVLRKWQLGFPLPWPAAFDFHLEGDP